MLAVHSTILKEFSTDNKFERLNLNYLVFEFSFFKTIFLFTFGRFVYYGLYTFKRSKNYFLVWKNENSYNNKIMLLRTA